MEKEISYSTTNTYSTLNNLSETTENVWIVIHGLGFLSRYFINYFNTLDASKNYIIAPQAPAKQYLNGKFKHVGASWLTKENTAMEIDNVLSYLNNVYQAEQIPAHLNLIILGFSQGVSIATRWIAKHQIKCNTLALYAGKVPREFKATQFEQLKEVKLIVGTKDTYVTKEVLKEEQEYCNTIFGSKLSFISFDGSHEVKQEVINSLV